MKRFFLWLIVLAVLFFAGRFVWLFYNQTSTLVEKIPVVEPVPVSALTTVQNLANKVGDQNMSWTDIIEQKKLQAKQNSDALRDLAFAQSFVGDLAGAQTSLDEYCVGRESWEACKKTHFEFQVNSPKDGSGKALTDVDFSVLGTSPDQIVSSRNIDLYKNTVIRTRVSKKGYSDFVTKTQFVTWPNEVVDSKTVTVKPTLLPAQKSLKIDAGKPFEAKTTNYTFTGEGNNFVFADGKPVTGEIEIFFWDLDNASQGIYASSLLNLDSFDQAGNNTGSGMVSQGMPLVKAYSGETELKVSKPIKGVGKMQDLQEYFDIFHSAKKLSAKTIFEKVPKNTPIDIKLAREYFLPPFWRYDSSFGVWTSSEFTVLDNTGLIEFKLY